MKGRSQGLGSHWFTGVMQGMAPRELELLGFLQVTTNLASAPPAEAGPLLGHAGAAIAE